jgi:hypothetical protein
VIDPDWQYRLALDRGESLREEAAARRLARWTAPPGRSGRVALRAFLGDLLIRAGRALGEDRRSGNATTSRIVARGSLDEGRYPTRPLPDNGTWVVSLTGAPLSWSPSTSTPGMSAAWMARSVPRDGLDRLLRDLDRLARDSAPGELRER